MNPKNIVNDEGQPADNFDLNRIAAKEVMGWQWHPSWGGRWVNPELDAPVMDVAEWRPTEVPVLAYWLFEQMLKKGFKSETHQDGAGYTVRFHSLEVTYSVGEHTDSTLERAITIAAIRMVRIVEGYRQNRRDWA